VENQENIRKPKYSVQWTDPWLWIFLIIAGAGCAISSYQSKTWLSGIAYFAAIIVASLLVLFFTRKTVPTLGKMQRPTLESWVMLGYYLVFLILSFITQGGGLFGGEFSKWLWFIALPILLVFLFSLPQKHIASLFQSIGLRSQGLKKAVLLAFLSYAVFVFIIPIILPESQWQTLQTLFHTPLKLVVLIPLSFLFSLMTAAFTEEVFFRGILQTRLSIIFRSEIRSCLSVAFLFGIYHLPYAFYLTSWPTHGNMIWAISSVLAEQMMAGLLLGILWFRTRNLAAPILFHALVNTAAIMTSININFG
jgi:membrane protease YdiL (CAAX protease family)